MPLTTDPSDKYRDVGIHIQPATHMYIRTSTMTGNKECLKLEAYILTKKQHGLQVLKQALTKVQRHI